jgi:hypothetical protein
MENLSDLGLLITFFIIIIFYCFIIHLCIQGLGHFSPMPPPPPLPPTPPPSFCCFFFETGSHYVAQAVLKLPM